MMLVEIKMSDKSSATDKIFPKDPNKTYALVELMRGESPMVDKGPDDTAFAFPVVLLIELILLLGVSLGLFLFSLLKQAPLDELANPMVTTDPAKAPWYFVGLQELLEHMHPVVAGILIPTVLVAFLVILPYIDRAKFQPGIWFSSSKGKRVAGWVAVYTLLVMPAYIILDNAFTVRELLREVVPAWVAQGVVPGGILLLLVVLPLVALWLTGAKRHDYLIALFTMMIVSAGVFTVSGFLFRGPGFKLFLPWEMPNNYNPWADF
jgi:hypothetical protein